MHHKYNTINTILLSTAITMLTGQTKVYMETSAVICNGHVKGFTLLLPSVFPQIKVQFNWKGEMEKCQRDSIYCFHIRMDGQKE